VLYLFALATCLASLLRLIAANRKVRALGVAAASLVVILATAALQLAGPSSRQQARAADLLTDFNNHQDCAVSSMVQLCAYRAYSSWVRDWLAAVEGVLEAVPSHELPDRIRIRQLLEPLGSVAPPQISDRLVNRWQPGGRDRAQDLLPETELYVGSTWRRDDGRDAFALAIGIANWSVGLPPSRRALAPSVEFRSAVLEVTRPEDERAVRTLLAERSYDACSALGQARAAIALWLAAGSLNETELFFAQAVESDPADGASLEGIDQGPYMTLAPAPLYYVSGDPVLFGEREGLYALDMLRSDQRQMRASIAERWDEFMSPGFSSDMMAAELGLPRLPEDSDEGAGEYSLAALGLVPCP
jgi:hypothetical protein